MLPDELPGGGVLGYGPAALPPAGNAHANEFPFQVVHGQIRGYPHAPGSDDVPLPDARDRHIDTRAAQVIYGSHGLDFLASIGYENDGSLHDRSFLSVPCKTHLPARNSIPLFRPVSGHRKGRGLLNPSAADLRVRQEMNDMT
jgi:hypothetical protein